MTAFHDPQAILLTPEGQKEFLKFRQMNALHPRRIFAKDNKLGMAVWRTDHIGTKYTAINLRWLDGEKAIEQLSYSMSQDEIAKYFSSWNEE